MGPFLHEYTNPGTGTLVWTTFASVDVLKLATADCALTDGKVKDPIGGKSPVLGLPDCH